ncbi:unnamed protein product [Rhizoctonia solani]|uniref:Uncharacterized protein n=1 Tax=Rhizoctonia solani TaxID=456999 RepID=A0A8H2WJR6_9AGAM|nr:unnamed protein product [Rhizoctonia solani]
MLPPTFPFSFDFCVNKRSAPACVAVVSGLPRPTGHKADRLRPRHSISTGDLTKTITVTVSLGPSTTVALGSASPTDSCADEVFSTSTTALTGASPSLPSVVVSTVTLTTEIATTIFPSATSLLSFSFSESTSAPTLALSTVSSNPPPIPTSTDSNFNPITAPSIGGGNDVLAQNAADAQELNRKYRKLTFRDSCVDKDEACIGDGRAFCTLGKLDHGYVWILTWALISRKPLVPSRNIGIHMHNDGAADAIKGASSFPLAPHTQIIQTCLLPHQSPTLSIKYGIRLLCNRPRYQQRHFRDRECVHGYRRRYYERPRSHLELLP